jgi:hypothetical protein
MTNVNEIAANEGEIMCCRWNGKYLAWANSTGVRIYDIVTQQVLAKLGLFTPQQRALSKIYPFSLCWRGYNELFIACGNRIIVYKINDKQDERGRFVFLILIFT